MNMTCGPMHVCSFKCSLNQQTSFKIEYYGFKELAQGLPVKKKSVVAADMQYSTCGRPSKLKIFK